MPIFQYEARTADGRTQSGRVEAQNEEAAADILQGHNLLIVALESAANQPFYTRRIGFFDRVGGKDIAVFSRQLSVLFEADVPLISSLYTLAEQTSSHHLREAILEIATNVDGGAPFSDSLAQYPDIFSNFYVQMVKAGEASGKLDEVLGFLAVHAEREYHTNSKIRGAMMYPAFVISAFVIIGALMLFFVIPQLLEVLTQTKGELPIMTRAIIWASNFTRNYWHISLVAFAAAVVGAFQYLKTPSGKRAWQELQLRIPAFKELAQKIYVFRFAESFGMLIRGGVPVARSLDISANIVGNVVYHDIIKEAQERVTRGEDIGTTLARYPEMPKLVSQMVSVGERTGKLDSILDNIARFYEEEVNTAIDNITSLIEPIMIVVLGVFVGLLVAGILLPIYTSISSLQ
jgi:type IV pilus assembly protein PilC